MSPRAMSKATTTQRTRIEDISLLGEELSEERLRLVAGGMIKQSHYPTNVGGTTQSDSDDTSVRADTL